MRLDDDDDAELGLSETEGIKTLIHKRFPTLPHTILEMVTYPHTHTVPPCNRKALRYSHSLARLST